MTRKPSDKNNHSSNAQTPNSESGSNWWSSPGNPLRKEYWVEIFTSDDWFLRRIKWVYIVLALLIAINLTFAVIQYVPGN